MKLVAWMNSALGRGARAGLGLAMIVVGLMVGGGGGVVLAAAGLVPLAAGAFGVCLLAPLLKAPTRLR